MADDELEMEHGFLKAPWEVLMRTFRSNHKSLIKDAESIADATTAMVADTRSASGSGVHQPPEAVADRIDAIIARLELLQSRLHKARASDRDGLDVCAARIEHLARRTRPNFEADTTYHADTPAKPEHTILAESTNGKIQPPRKSLLAPSDGIKLRSAAGAVPDGSSDDSSVDGGRNGAQLDAQARWEKTRLDRVLVDYMHRSGLYRSGAELAVSEGIGNLVDTQLFREARIVISALRARNCGPALKWCSENKRRLGKAKSTLEFQLHRQVFIEYARAGEKVQAIEYARKWLAGRGSSSNTSNSVPDAERSADIGHFMGLLVFPADTQCQPYKNMYAVHKWLELEEKFKQENYRLHGLTPESTLEVLLKAGLASLKTRKCGKSTCEGDGKDYKAECPTCNEPYLTLAEKLPRAHHVNSVLVCAISGDIMDENNPPMALPNGNVYSLNALQEMATSDSENRVKDPKSKQLFQFNQLRKCFIL